MADLPDDAGEGLGPPGSPRQGETTGRSRPPLSLGGGREGQQHGGDDVARGRMRGSVRCVRRQAMVRSGGIVYTATATSASDTRAQPNGGL